MMTDILAQLAQNFRRLNLKQTADLCEREAEMLTQQFGPLIEWRVNPRTVPVWLDQYVTTLRQHAAYRLRLDDLGGALRFQVSISLLAHLAAESAQLTPRAAENVVEKVRRVVSGAFERIVACRGNEFSTARFLSERKWQETKTAALNQQKRERQIAELSAIKARLEVLTQ